MDTITNTLTRIGACQEAIEWAADKPTWDSVIRQCNQPDWLLWLDQRLNILTDSERRLLACWFVRNTPIGDGRTVWDLLTDDRSRKAVEVAERHARGEATDEERAAAWHAAWDAAWHAAWDAAGDAAWDAAWDAARDAARDAQESRLRKMLNEVA